ncbi:MFS transporter [Paenibacillus rhizoplanae]
MALLDTTIINIALPEMTRQFGGSVSQVSWVMNGYNLAFAVFILTASRLADQFGRKKVFLIGVGLFTLSSLLAGLSTSLGMLILFRVIQGLAGAIIVPVTIPLSTTTFPKEMHGLIIGIWGAVSGVAAASGPALGGNSDTEAELGVDFCERTAWAAEYRADRYVHSGVTG